MVAVAAAAVAAVVAVATVATAALVTEPLAQPSLETYLLDEQRTQVKGRCTAQSARPQLLLGRRTLASCESTGRTPRRAAPESGNPSVQGRDTRQGLIATAQLSYTRVLYTCQLFLLIPVVLTFGTCDL